MAPAGPRNARRAKAVISTAKRAAGDSEAEGEEDSDKDSEEDADRGSESREYRGILGDPSFLHLRAGPSFQVRRPLSFPPASRHSHFFFRK